VSGPHGVAELSCHELQHPDGRMVWVYGREPGPWSDLASAASPPGEHEALHRRLDRSTGQWVAVSPTRNRRPDAAAASPTPSTDACPLCPGGAELPATFDAAVFENRFPTFAAAAPLLGTQPWAAPSTGACEVIVYTDAHDGSLASLPADEVVRVVGIWRHRAGEHWARLGNEAGYVMAFENRGVEVGATLSHPHGQLYAFGFVPPRVALKAAALADHRARDGGCLACSLVDDDLASDRVVAVTPGWVAAVPYAARWPYEVHLRSRRHGVGRLADLGAAEVVELAGLLRDVVGRLDGLFGFELAYLLAVQEAPAGAPDWHLHVELAPPQRNPTSLKVRASVETALDVFINDAVPEESAAALRAAGPGASGVLGQ
jgi:UDPglucose--hexose-1-phosphate uridylyltransferase